MVGRMAVALQLHEQPWPDGEFRLFELGSFVSEEIATAERWASVFGVGPFSMGYEAKEAHYERRGYHVVGDVAAHGHRGAYVDAADDFGFFIEVLLPAEPSCSRSPTFRVHNELGCNGPCADPDP